MDVGLGARMPNGVICEIRNQIVDFEWDTFVEAVPGGYYMQSGMWSAFKAHLGWSPIRIVLKNDAAIVAGAQVLVRQLRFGLKIASVQQGPVLARYDPELFNTVIDCLVKLIRINKINYLALQPERNCGEVDDLNRRGFQVSQILGGQRATLLVDLAQPSEIVLQQMRRTTRNNTRLAENQGIQVRQGTFDDLSVFSQLLKATGRRHKFTPVFYDYYTKMWRHLEPLQHIKLFIAEYKCEAISGLLTVPFGDTVVMTALGWSGGKTWLRPNELLIWRAMEWSKDNGYLKFDLGGIDVSAARALIAGHSLPENVKSSPTRFKIGFGGSAELLSPSYEYISNRALRLLMRISTALLGRKDLSMVFHRILSADDLSIRGLISLIFNPGQ